MSHLTDITLITHICQAQQAKLQGAYLKFLEEAISYYTRLVWRMQWAFGDVGANIDLDRDVQVWTCEICRQVKVWNKYLRSNNLYMA